VELDSATPENGDCGSVLANFSSGTLSAGDKILFNISSGRLEIDFAIVSAQDNRSLIM
jgi:hypothetical protein